MRRISVSAVAAAVASAAVATFGVGAARAEKCPNMLIVLDRSGSMLEDTKWEIATEAINTFVPERQSVMRFGLMVFPAPGQTECGGGGLFLNSCESFNAAEIAGSLATVRSPQGYTPTAQALDEAARFPDMTDAARRRFIVLLTDGDPTCPSGNGEGTEGDVVATEQSLANLLAAGVKTFVIGFGQGVTPSRLDRLAAAGGAPRASATCADPANPAARIPCKYYDASDLASLNAAFDEIASIAQGELQGNSCDDSCYPIGGCPEGQRCTQNVVSYSGGKHTLNLGQCVADPCFGTSCPEEGQFCREGACVAACLAPCPAGEYCRDGTCAPDPCSNPAACACSRPCEKFLVCLEGTCMDDPCRYVHCPAVAPYCDRGSCYAASKPPVVSGTDGGAAGHDAGDGEGGGGNGGCSTAAGVGSAVGVWILLAIPGALRSWQRRRVFAPPPPR